MCTEGLVLSTKERICLDVIYKVHTGQLSRRDARELLDISDSTLKRYLRDFKKEGMSFIVHGNRKREPRNKTPNEIKEAVQDLIKERYFDFNVLHIQEKLETEHEITVKRETLRKWCHQISLVKRCKKRRSKPRFYRERMSQAGLLVMLDGSHHRWFADVDCCMIAAIDDATSEVLYAEFFYGETTLGCFKVLKGIVTNKGTFKVLYTDKAGVYGGIKRSGFSQVERALGELGIDVMYAHSPEAKGRIERLFQTLQDRLVPEMRLKGIKTMAEANRFLQQEYLPHAHNPRFSVLAHSTKSAFTKLHASVDLESIFCLKEYRTVAKNHTISFQGARYMVDCPLKYSIHDQKLEIRIDENKNWQAYFAGKPIRLVKINEIKPIAA